MTAKKSFCEWFDPQNIEHLKAYFQLQNTGMWPDKFIPVNIFIEPNWPVIIAFKLANCWIDYKLLLPNENQIGGIE